MKIVIVSSLFGLRGGGAGLTPFYLAHGLKDEGHHVTIVTLGRGFSYSFALEDGVGVYRFRPLNFYALDEKDIYPRWQRILWQIWDIYNFHSGWMLKRILEKESPDIVHIHKMRGLSGAVWSVAAHLYPGRVIQTCHDYESMSPDGLLRGSVGRMALERKWPVRSYQLIRTRLSAGISRITAPSRFTLQRIIDSGLFPSSRASIVPNSHGWTMNELNTLQARQFPHVTDKVRFLFLGRLESEKGIVNLCEAFLKAYQANPNIELDIAGWGSLEAQLINTYARYPGIKFLGTIQGKSKEDVLSNASIVVIPSLVDEVFGLVTVEAFAFGKSVIASSVGGLPELVQPNETGWLVPPGDVDSLVEQLLFVSKLDPVVLKKMSQNCKEFSYQFAVERILGKYLDLYGELIK